MRSLLLLSLVWAAESASLLGMAPEPPKGKPEHHPNAGIPPLLPSIERITRSASPKYSTGCHVTAQGLYQILTQSDIFDNIDFKHRWNEDVGFPKLVQLGSVSVNHASAAHLVELLMPVGSSYQTHWLVGIEYQRTNNRYYTILESYGAEGFLYTLGDFLELTKVDASDEASVSAAKAAMSYVELSEDDFTNILHAALKVGPSTRRPGLSRSAMTNLFKRMTGRPTPDALSAWKELTGFEFDANAVDTGRPMVVLIASSAISGKSFSVESLQLACSERGLISLRPPPDRG